MKISKCRICGNTEFKQILDLGKTPLVNSFLKKDQIKKNEKRYPLNVIWCEKCNLMQIDEVVPPEIMFKNYLYVSGTSPALKQHFTELAKDAIEKKKGKNGELVIDIASNDGTLLKEFKKEGMEVLGIDPAENIVEIARKAGIPTECDFINEVLSKKIVDNNGQASIITATNVIAHINDLEQLLNSVNILLKSDGIFVVEVPYMVDLINNTEFDTIYHEHLSYFGVHPMKFLLEKYGFKIIDIKHVQIHGGTIRVFACKKNASYPINSTVDKFLENEIDIGINFFSYYQDFAQNVEKIKTKLLLTLKKLKEKDKKIVGYGASGKGNTLLNYFGINAGILDFIADLNPLKQNHYTPGTHIPIIDPKIIDEEKPDYMLILAWNFKEEIMKQQDKIRKWGGKFIIPIPEVDII